MIKLTERAVKVLLCTTRILTEFPPIRGANNLYQAMRDMVGPRGIIDEDLFVDEHGDLIRWAHVEEAVQEAELARVQAVVGSAIDTSPLIERIVAILNRGAFASNFITNSAYRQLRQAVLRQDEINAMAARLATRLECSCGWVFQPGKCELVTLTIDANGLPVIRCQQCKPAKVVRCDKSGCTTLSILPATLAKRLAQMSCEKNGGEAADGQENAAIAQGDGMAVGAANEIGPFQRAVRAAERDRLRGLVRAVPMPGQRAVQFDMEVGNRLNQQVFAQPAQADNHWIEIGPGIEVPAFQPDGGF